MKIICPLTRENEPVPGRKEACQLDDMANRGQEANPTSLPHGLGLPKQISRFSGDLILSLISGPFLTLSAVTGWGSISLP